MSYETTVWPGLMGVLEQVKSVKPMNNPAKLPDGTSWPNEALQGWASGEQLSVPATPFAWLINERLGRDRRTGGQDREATTYDAIIRLFHDHTNDSERAEMILMPLVELVSQAFRAHIKMGFPTIERALIESGDWGYISVDGIWYRSIDLTVQILEKEVKPYAA